jgi:hypothetical protein
MAKQEFSATLDADDRGHVRIRLPFDPTEVWGKRKRHYVRGTINDVEFDGSLGSRGGAWFFPVNKSLREQLGATTDEPVRVTMEATESQDAAMPADLTSALAGDPEAMAFFQGLSGFYQRQYVGWIEGAKKADTRASRVAEVVGLLRKGQRQR